MPAIVLPYNRDHGFVTQNFYWDCGPASGQLVLNARGQTVSEEQLIAVMGTDEGGTDSIDQVASGLNQFDPESAYASFWMASDPATPDQVATMRDYIFRSVMWGRGCVANFVVPPNNYPRAVTKADKLLPGADAASPAYGPGQIWHYVSVMGIDTDDDTVLVVDPGFQPGEYWCSVSSLATYVTPHGVVYSAAAPAIAQHKVDPAPTPTHSAAELLSYAMDEALPLERYEALLPGVLSCLEASQCTNVERIAQWMAQTGHESLGLSAMEEFASGEAYEGRADLGNTEPGDGVRYKGRSAIMITGRTNYGAVSAWAYGEGYVDSPNYFVDNPEQMASDDYGFMGTAWYWKVARGTQINDAADREDHETVCRLINGGLNGYDDRVARYARAKEVAPQFLTILDNSGPPETGDDSLSALTADEQKEMLFLLRILADEQFPSRSPFRHINEGPVDTVAGMTLNTDASSHIMLVIRLAELGDTGALDLLNEIAGCTDAERQGDAKLAQRVLAGLRTSQTPPPRPAAAPPQAPAAPHPAPRPVRPAGGRWRL